MSSQEHEHLAESNRHIAEFRRRISEQEKLIAEFQRDGHPTGDAEQLLRQFRETLRLGEEHRQLIMTALEQE